MKHEGDSSLLKSLAVAFGDGLAFGVGVKLAQSSARKRPQSAPPEIAAPAAAAPESLDLHMLSQVFASIDAKLAQHTTKIERRLADSNSASQDTLEEIHAAISGRVDALEQGMAGRLEAALEARLQAYVDARIQALEQRLHIDITAAGDRTAKLLVDTIETRLLERIALLQAEVRRQAGTIQTLSTASAGSEQKLHDLLNGIQRACQQVAGAAPKEEPEDRADAGSGGAAAADIEEPQPENPANDRRFDSLKLVNWQARSERKLPIPLVSSLAVFVLGLLAVTGF